MNSELTQKLTITLPCEDDHVRINDADEKKRNERKKNTETVKIDGKSASVSLI